MPAIHFDITGDNSNMVAAIQDTTEKVRRMAETVDNLRGADPFDGMKDASKALNDAIKDNEKNIASLRERLKELTRQQAEAASKGDMAGVARLSSEMESVAQVIQTTSQQTDRYKESLAALGQDADKTSGIMVKLLGGQEKYNAIISQLPGPLKNAVTGLNGMVGAAKAFIATPLGAVIAALVAAYKTLTTWFNKSAEGQLAFAKISGALSGTLNALMDIVMDVGEALYKAFSDPKAAINELWQSFKNNLIGRIKASLGVFTGLGKVIESAFKGDFKEAGEAAKEMGNNFQKIFTGKDVDEIKAGTEALKERGRKIVETAKAQSDLTYRQQQLHRKETAWLSESAELEKKIAEERNKLRMGSQSERAAASARMQELINQKTQREVELAREAYEIKRDSNNLTRSSQEDLDEEARLQARITQIETQGVTQKGFALRIQDSMGRSIGQTAEQLRELQRSYEELTISMGEDSERLERETQALVLEAQSQGYEKQKQLAELEHQNKLAAIDKQYRERLKKLEDMQKKEYKLSHGGSLAGFTFDTSDSAVIQANSNHKKETDNEVLRYSNERKAILDEYKSFARQYEEITKDYAAKINDLMSQGADNGALAMARKSESDALVGLAKSWAASGIDKSMERWYGELAQQTYGDLAVMLDSLEAEFALMGDRMPTDEAAKLKAQITLVRDALEKGSYASDDIAEDAKESLVNWTDINRVLSDTAKLFEQAGNSIGGVFGDMLKAVGRFSTFATQIGNGVERIKELNKQGAGFSVEKLSAGLGIAGAALSIGTEVAGKIIEAKKYMDELDRSTAAYLKTLETIRDSRAIDSLSNAFGANEYGQFREYSRIAMEARENIAKAFTDYPNKNFLSSEMGTSFQKLLGLGKQYTLDMTTLFDESGELITENLKSWYETYGEGMDESSKRFVEGVLKEAERLASAKSGIKGYLGGLFGDIASDMASDMVDQYIATGDAIVDMTRYMDDFGKSIAKSIVQAKLMENIFTADAQDEIADLIAAGKTSEAVNAFNNLMSQAGDLVPSINQFLEGIGLEGTGQSSNVEASSKGFAAMSQDTASELNGRFTAIQISNETIAQGMTTAVTTLLAMQAMMAGDGSALSDIRDMHILEAGYLADIAKQTKPIPGMVEMIDKIERNTSRL